MFFTSRAAILVLLFPLWVGSPVFAGGSESAYLSIVVPAYNEAKNLPSLVAEIHRTGVALGRPFEIIVVDDRSTDNTYESMLGMKNEFPELVVKRLQVRGGQSASLAAGFDAARGNIIATLDGDGQNDPADIPRLLDRMTETGADLVAGWRVERHDTRARRIASLLGNTVRGWAIGKCVHDSGCGIKVMRKDRLETLPYFKNMHRFFPNLFAMMDYRVVEEKVNHRPRAHGKSNYTNFGRMMAGISDLCGFRWLQSRALKREVE